MSTIDQFSIKRRCSIWPLLTECDIHCIYNHITDDERKSLYEMVSLDVNRTHYLLRDIPEENRQDIRDIVLDIIMRILTLHNDLNYFQGYHEVVTIIYLLLRDQDVTYKVVRNLTLTRFKDFMDSDFEGTIRAINLVGVLLRAVDRELYLALKSAEVTFDFAVASILTWFAHSASLDSLAGIFEFIIKSDSSETPIYLVVASLCQRRDEIMRLCIHSDQFSTLFTAISQLPLDFPVDSLLKKAHKLGLDYPDIESLEDEVVPSRGYMSFVIPSFVIFGVSVAVYFYLG